MIKTFTPNDVIRYFYNETSQSENKAIEKALIIDAELMEEYKHLNETAELLNSIKRQPSDTVINNILRYSKESESSVCK
jgi:hypothetical protein